MPFVNAWTQWYVSALEASRASLRALEPPNVVPIPRKEPLWATPNRVTLRLNAVELRMFERASSATSTSSIPTLIVAPFALHDAMIADLAPGHSIIERLTTEDVGPLFVLRCLSANRDMADLTIDDYLCALNVAVDDLGGRANLIGLCQGGWLSLAYAGRFPHKVASLCLAGSPIDLDAVASPIVESARAVSPETVVNFVRAGQGRALGRSLARAWDLRVLPKEEICNILQVDEGLSPTLQKRFRHWHQWTMNLPGRYYIQVVEEIFRQNALAKGEFVALGRKIDLKHYKAPLFILCGEQDDVAPKGQMLPVADLVGTPTSDIEQCEVPGGHLSVFLGKDALAIGWVRLAHWLRSHSECKRRTARSR